MEKARQRVELDFSQKLFGFWKSGTGGRWQEREHQFRNNRKD